MPMTQAELRVLSLRERLALLEIEEGRISGQAIQEISTAAKLCTGLARLGYGDPGPELSEAAGLHIARMSEGHRLDASAIDALRSLLDALDAQRLSAPRGRVMQAAGLLAWR